MQSVRSLGKKGGTSRAVFPLPGAPGKRCLDALASLSPRSPRTRGPVGPQDVGSGSIRSVAAAAPPGLPYLARPALARRKTERSRGRGVPAPARALARSLARWLGSSALSAARSTCSFQSRPAPPPAPARPQPLLHSRSPAANRASTSSQTPPTLPSSDAPARRCPPRGAESSGSPTLCWSSCLLAPSTPSQTASQRAAGMRHWAGKVTEPREVRTVLWVPICESGRAGPRVVGSTGR